MTAAFEQAAAGPLTIERVGLDRYDRTLARIAGALGDLSCRQLAGGHAVYKAGWNDGLRVVRTCPGALVS